jgi:hypothetical protein
MYLSAQTLGEKYGTGIPRDFIGPFGLSTKPLTQQDGAYVKRLYSLGRDLQ